MTIHLVTVHSKQRAKDVTGGRISHNNIAFCMHVMLTRHKEKKLLPMSFLLLIDQYFNAFSSPEQYITFSMYNFFYTKMVYAN